MSAHTPQKTLLHFIFLGIITGEIIGVVWLPTFELIFKPLIMVWVGVYFYLSTKRYSSESTGLMLAAFFFSWMGDILLMFQTDKEPVIFIAGLASFLIAHTCYIRAFYMSVVKEEGKSILLKKPIYTVLIVLYGCLLYYILFPNLNLVLKVAVFIYALALVLMALTALNRYQKVRTESFNFVFIGALLFVISDSCIAINKFLFPFKQAHLLVMLTYMGAQYMIMRGVILQVWKS